jgi:hypothetical protein
VEGPGVIRLRQDVSVYMEMLTRAGIKFRVTSNPDDKYVVMCEHENAGATFDSKGRLTYIFGD